MKATLLLIPFLYLSSFSLGSLITEHNTVKLPHDEIHEVRYLPRGPGLELLSLGYKNALANLLWFKTMAYFGEHYRGDKNYKWLYHMCDIISTLDPQNRRPFLFGGLMLGSEAKFPDAAIRLLTKGISHHPQDWEFYYIRGFTHYLFNNDIDSAIKDLAFAAKLPNAPHILATVATKKILMTNKDSSTKISFLHDMLNTVTDPYSKEVIQKRLSEVTKTINK